MTRFRPCCRKSWPRRAVKLATESEADVVVYEPTTYQFAHRAALTRIRRRWPWLYAPALTAMNPIKAAGGNEFEGGRSARGLIFRAPRSLAFHAIGADAEHEVETSMAYVLAILDEVLRLEQPALVVSTPKFQWREPDMRWCRAQVAIAAATLSGYCLQHRIPVYDVEKTLAAEGKTPGLARDALHYDKATRAIEARLIAREVVAVLQV